MSGPKAPDAPKLRVGSTVSVLFPYIPRATRLGDVIVLIGASYPSGVKVGLKRSYLCTRIRLLSALYAHEGCAFDGLSPFRGVGAGPVHRIYYRNYRMGVP